MRLFEVGRVCVKTMGREAGSYCVIVEKMNGKYVVVTGPKHISGVRRRRVNTRHIEPIDKTLPIKEGADDNSVEKALKEAGLEETFRTKIRLSE